jgi:hypothetical protein
MTAARRQASVSGAAYHLHDANLGVVVSGVELDQPRRLIAD